MKKGSLFSSGGLTESERYIHTPSMFAKQNLLYVQEVGRLLSLKPHKCVRQNLDSYLFMMVLEGKGCLDMNGKHYEISKGCCALIDCMEHYEHVSDEQNAWKLAWVHFNGHAAKSYYELFLKNNKESNVFRVEDVEGWNSIIGELMAKQSERNLQAELQSGEMLLRLMNSVIDRVANVAIIASEQENQKLIELRELLNEQYAEAKVLQIIEESFGEEAKWLSNRFYEKFGISIEEYISNRRLNAAKELLRFSIKPIEEIAKESGIGDMIVMQQMFRECDGMTAEEYRMKWAQWVR